MKKKILRVGLIVLGLLLVLFILAAVAYRLADRTNGSLLSSGVERRYLLYVPDSYDPAVPTPLVISIHGFAEWPAHQMQISQWTDLADENGFIVVFPSGTGLPKRWRMLGALDSDTAAMQDVAFISDLIDKLAQEYNLDPAQIYANGLSNGGGMSYVLSCELSEHIAAFGSVSGAYLTPWEACNPSRQVPAILFHGTADQIVPYQGGPSRAFHLSFPDIPAWVASLAERNGCDGSALESQVSAQVSRQQYIDCAADLVFYAITDGGHSWPGGERLPERIVGHTTQDIDATRLMWDFFQQHPLDGK
jgi:polyhydroxybutyrate depolymerase